jgi:hypothetical protein
MNKLRLVQQADSQRQRVDQSKGEEWFEDFRRWFEKSYLLSQVVALRN